MAESQHAHPAATPQILDFHRRKLARIEATCEAGRPLDEGQIAFLIRMANAYLARPAPAGTPAGILPDDAILRATVIVRPTAIATQLTFAPQTKFADGARAVAQAAAHLEAERVESVNCPAWRADFVDGRPARG